MKEAFVDQNLNVEVRDVPVPSPGPGQILIRTAVSGINPKDWKVPRLIGGRTGPFNPGDDIAGYVKELGDGVCGFRIGDRVAAFHEMMSPHGSFAEFSIARARTTFHIPTSVSFEEAATLPLATMTAALAVHQRLGLPLPWNPVSTPTPLIVNGAASAVGAFAIKLAVHANIHPIVAIAGNGIWYVETLIDRSKGDTIIDYRKGDEHVIYELNRHRQTGQSVVYAVDAVSEQSSVEKLSQLQVTDLRIATVLVTNNASLPGHAKVFYTNVGTVHKEYNALSAAAVPFDQKFGRMFFPYLGVGLEEGWLRGHPYEVVSGGLFGVEAALKTLSQGKVSAKKLVVRIASDPIERL